MNLWQKNEKNRILKTIYGKHLLDFYKSVFKVALILTFSHRPNWWENCLTLLSSAQSAKNGVISTLILLPNVKLKLWVST